MSRSEHDPDVREHGKASPPEIDMQAFARRLVQYRSSLGWSQAELARQVKVANTTALHWEKGRKLPKTDELIRICRALGVPVDELLHGPAEGAEVKSRDLIRFFATPEGAVLNLDQRRGLARFLADREQIEPWKLQAVVKLLFDTKGEK